MEEEKQMYSMKQMHFYETFSNSKMKYCFNMILKKQFQNNNDENKTRFVILFVKLLIYTVGVYGLNW